MGQCGSKREGNASNDDQNPRTLSSDDLFDGDLGDLPARHDSLIRRSIHERIPTDLDSIGRLSGGQEKNVTVPSQSRRSRASSKGSESLPGEHVAAPSPAVGASKRAARTRDIIVQPLDENLREDSGHSFEMDPDAMDTIKKKYPREKIKIHVATWNMGSAAPPSSLSDWLPLEQHRAHIYVVCVQECEYPPRAAYSTCEQDWFARLDSHFGSSFVRLEAFSISPKVKSSGELGHRSGEIRTALFVSRAWENEISDIGHHIEATGRSGHHGRGGNKGGLLLWFRFLDSRLCFVNAHLEAHAEEMAKRGENVRDIMSSKKKATKISRLVSRISTRVGRRPSSTYEVDNEMVYEDHSGEKLGLSDFNAIFWAGDLNYHLDGLPWDDAIELIEQERYGDLLTFDQLRAEMRDARVLDGFVEGPIRFPPTYKFKRGKDTYARKTRAKSGVAIPSYTDRILFHKWPGQHISLVDYTSVPSIRTSDHRPVYAQFIAEIDRPYHSKGAKRAAFIIVRNVSLQGMESAKKKKPAQSWSHAHSFSQRDRRFSFLASAAQPDGIHERDESIDWDRPDLNVQRDRRRELGDGEFSCSFIPEEIAGATENLVRIDDNDTQVRKGIPHLVFYGGSLESEVDTISAQWFENGVYTWRGYVPLEPRFSETLFVANKHLQIHVRDSGVDGFSDIGEGVLPLRCLFGEKGDVQRDFQSVAVPIYRSGARAGVLKFELCLFREPTTTERLKMSLSRISLKSRSRSGSASMPNILPAADTKSDSVGENRRFSDRLSRPGNRLSQSSLESGDIDVTSEASRVAEFLDNESRGSSHESPPPSPKKNDKKLRVQVPSLDEFDAEDVSARIQSTLSVLSASSRTQSDAADSGASTPGTASSDEEAAERASVLQSISRSISILQGIRKKPVRGSPLGPRDSPLTRSARSKSGARAQSRPRSMEF